MTKFWHKFARLRQVNTPSSWDKFQNCCTDIYLIRFLPNFTVFCVFLWISRDFAALPKFRGSATARNIRSPVYRFKNKSCVVVFFSHRTKCESPAGEQFWKFSRQCSIFDCIGDQWVAISSPENKEHFILFGNNSRQVQNTTVIPCFHFTVWILRSKN